MWVGGPHGTEARVRYEADGREEFVGVVLCNVLSQRQVGLLNFWCVLICGQTRGRSRCFSEKDDARGGSAQPMDRVCVGDVLLHQAEEGVFHEAAAGEGGQPAGFVDGQQLGVFKQDFEVLRAVWFVPGWTVSDKGLAESDRFASVGGDTVDGDFAVVQSLLPGLRC